MKNYFTIFLFLISQLIISQEHTATLHGKVTHKNGKAVETAVILIHKTSLYATIENGNFKIEKLPLNKRYKLEIRGVGKESFFTDFLFNSPEKTLFIPLHFNEEINLSEVVISAKSKDKVLKDQGFTMNVIQTQDAVVKNIQTSELLDRSAGIKIRQTAGMGSDISFNLNGLTGNAVRIFIDGIPLRNYGPSFSVSSIPPSLIERIEVYKGVLPAELSEDALGGGVNIILKKTTKKSVLASYSIGSFGTHQADLNASYRSKESGFVANLASFYNQTDNNYKVSGNSVYVTDNRTGEITYITAKRFHDAYFSAGIKANVGVIQKKWADELLLGVLFSKTKKEIQTGATMHTVYGNRHTNYQTQLVDLQYKKNDLFLKGLDVSTFFSLSQTFRQVVDTVPYMYTWEGKIAKGYRGENLKWNAGAEAGEPTLADNNEINFSNRSNLHYHLGKNYTFAANYFLNQFSRKIDDPLRPNEQRANMDRRRYKKEIISFSFDAHFLDKKLKTTLLYKMYKQNVALTEMVRQRQGFSFTDTPVKNERTITDNGYGVTLAYTITPKITLTASGEKAIRLPGSTELLGNFSNGVSPSSNLRPEKGINGNIGGQFGPFLSGNHKVSAEVNFFVRDIRDMIIQGIPSTRDDFFRFENLGKIISRGFDVELRYNYGQRFFVTANFSNFNARFNEEYDQNGLKNAHYRNRLRNTPYLTANTNAEYIFKEVGNKENNLSLNYHFAYTHSFPLGWEAYGSANAIVLPAQPLHDFSATYSFKKQGISLSTSVKNIFDTQVFDNFALQKPGRAFYGKITYQF